MTEPLHSDKQGELKPCPCCGAAAKVDQIPHDPESENSGGYFIECTGCRLSTPLMFALMDDPLPSLRDTWNRRFALPPIAQMSYLNAISKVRHEILFDNEQPRDILISEALKYPVLMEINPYRMYRAEDTYETLMGMKIEWTKPVALTKPQISIRTANGDTRIVTMLDSGYAAPDKHKEE